ncbi:MAG: phosphatase PAP2 family protein [Ruminococcus sp.]|nr:phosphatase PAP2 family protein [Ruminococcus sp.]
MEFLINLDGNLLLWIQEYIRQDWMDGFWKVITAFGDSGIFWIALSILLLIPKQTRRIGITALAALAIGALITNIALKPLIGRTRPYEVIDGLVTLIGKQSDDSFPSGHTCASFAAAGVYWRMMPRKYGIPLLIFAALIAFSRLYVGVHYPSDVLGGLLIGLFAAWAAWRIQENLSEKKRISHKPL